MFCLLSALPAQARPVSYPGGWTTIQNNDASASTFFVHYSPTRHYSIGYRSEYRWRVPAADRWRTHGIQINVLAKRVNRDNSQFNLYVHAGAGVLGLGLSDLDDLDLFSAFFGLSLDWESRRYFVRYRNHLMGYTQGEPSFVHSVRTGVAPYLGDFGSWHTWLMLDIEQEPGHDDPMRYAFFVRILKTAVLAEAGFNTRGVFLFNWIVRF
ncbi:MAG: hypothetical protein K0U66_08955 [Gammaproteobacteria bacterium]|nr:hypothetical protein [Pseudomonadota bacterium]MCH9663765.1 hypothetical protein [Gammaproteobacteria bacterium]